MGLLDLSKNKTPLAIAALNSRLSQRGDKRKKSTQCMRKRFTRLKAEMKELSKEQQIIKDGHMRKRFKRLKAEMKEITKEQQSIKEGQRQVREQFKAAQEECQQLRQETNQIIRQTANTRIRLALMFDILKAREEGDFAKAAQLTRILREIVARD